MFDCRECGKTRAKIQGGICSGCKRRITLLNKRTLAEREQVGRDLEEQRKVLNRFFFGSD